jgi:hypothetical protein
MANIKNSDRRKRKYGDKRKSATARNKANRQARHKRRLRKLECRTLELVGRKVIHAGQPVLVLEMLERDDPRVDTLKPRGRYLVLESGPIVSRRSVKPVR